MILTAPVGRDNRDHQLVSIKPVGLVQLAWIKKHAVMIHFFIGHAATRVSPGQCNDSCAGSTAIVVRMT